MKTVKTKATAALLSLSTSLGLLFAPAAQAAGVSVADGLADAAYSASSTYDSSNTAKDLFNGGSWNAGTYGTHWVQVDLGTTQLIDAVSFVGNILPDNYSTQDVYLSDNFIGNGWSALTKVAGHDDFTAFGTTYDLSFAPQAGRYVEFVVNGGQSWTALSQATVDAVPEPGSYGLMALGLTFLGVSTLRRKTAMELVA